MGADMAKRWSVSSVKCVFFRTQAREFVSVTEGAGSLDGMSTWWRNMVSGEGETAVRSSPLRYFALNLSR